MPVFPFGLCLFPDMILQGSFKAASLEYAKTGFFYFLV